MKRIVSLWIVLLALLTALPSSAHAQSETVPLTREQMVALAAEYSGWEFDADYNGPMPTEVQARQAIEAVNASSSVSTHNSQEFLPVQAVRSGPQPIADTAGSTYEDFEYCDSWNGFYLEIRHKATVRKSEQRPHNIVSVERHQVFYSTRTFPPVYRSEFDVDRKGVQGPDNDDEWYLSVEGTLTTYVLGFKNRKKILTGCTIS